MKLSLLLSLLLASSVDAFSSSVNSAHSRTKSTQLYYDIQRDPSDENVWSVLANTEKWIASTLSDAKAGATPLSRKEVSYVCETSTDPAMILANIFRKLKEARELGEAHAQEQEEFVDEKGTFDSMGVFLYFFCCMSQLTSLSQRIMSALRFGRRKSWSFLPIMIWWIFTSSITWSMRSIKHEELLEITSPKYLWIESTSACTAKANATGGKKSKGGSANDRNS